MSKQYSVAVIVGSLRKLGLSKMTANALVGLAPDNLSFEFLEIGQLPLFNQDLEENPPQKWVDFREKLRPFDAVLFVTPEYNRSLPAALKNALDVGSRPYGHSVWNGKPPPTPVVDLSQRPRHGPTRSLYRRGAHPF